MDRTFLNILLVKHKFMSVPAALSYAPFSGLTAAQQLEESYARLQKEVAHYLDPEDMAVLLRTAVYGAKAHEGQMRQSGGPYFTHPIAVAEILASQRFDLPVLQAGLLHDVLEDTAVSKAEMAATFGNEVTELVDGVSKLDRLKDQAPQQVQAESFKKMLVATTDDPRVIIIKLADRLHNMRTLGALRRDKRIRKAKETLDIYASIAGRLGLFYFRMQLEDLVFSHLYPWRYAVLQKHYQQRFANNHAAHKVRHDLLPTLKSMGIKASITKRQRHLWGVYQRMQRKQSFDAACRTIPIRIITDSIDDCYRVLGVLHGIYRPISGKFEDYIAAPKSNGYRSLHTSVLTASGEVLNVQIRTHDMHSLAEMGIIAIWYQHVKNRSVQLEKHTIEAEKYMRDWLSRLREVQNITHDPLEFYDAIKKELSPGDIHVYTPKGEVIDLPRGATPVDFAYAVHTRIGNHCAAAKVNGELYPIFRPLEIAQTVEIITRPESHPNIGWLQFVVTAKARAGVNHYIRSLQYKEAQQLGRELLDKSLHERGSSLRAMEETALQDYLVEQKITIQQLFDDIAHGQRQSGLVASTILGGKSWQELSKTETLYIHSALDSAISMASCCYPLPYEPIIGHFEPQVGIKIHRRQCMISEVNDSQDWIRVAWAQEVSGIFISLIELHVLDKPMIISQITHEIAAAGSNIRDFRLERHWQQENMRIIKCWLAVENRDHLAKVMRSLRGIDGVIAIQRS